MDRRRLQELGGFTTFFLFLGAPVLAQTNEPPDAEYLEFEAERVHSDLPIYTFSFEELWPRSYVPEGSIGGCTSRVSFGDWEFTPNPFDQSANKWWLRMNNYGVFHCAANLYVADERDALEEGEFSRGLFVRLGVEDGDEPTRELWVLQEGFVPGSDYLLLARDLNENLVTTFTVLQRKCPIGAIRSVMGMDVWTTRYCAINSDDDMYRLASEMLKLPPLGELTLRPGLETPDASKPD